MNKFRKLFFNWFKEVQKIEKDYDKEIGKLVDSMKKDISIDSTKETYKWRLEDE